MHDDVLRTSSLNSVYGEFGSLPIKEQNDIKTLKYYRRLEGMPEKILVKRMYLYLKHMHVLGHPTSMPTEAYRYLKQLDLPRCFVSVYHNFEMDRKLDIHTLFSTISGVPTTLRY